MSQVENCQEKILNNSPAMLRCWVNEHSGAMLFPGEAHVIIEDAEDQADWNIVSEEKIILLGDSAKGDVLGNFRDAYVQVSIMPVLSSDESSYVVELSGIEQRKLRVSKDKIVFARRSDPIWEEIGEKLTEEAKNSKDQLLAPFSIEELCIDPTDGSWVR